MRPKITLITGANGEMGHSLINTLAKQSGQAVVAMDLQPLADDLRQYCTDVFTGDIRGIGLLDSLSDQYDVTAIYHLAALLSTSAERKPALAHDVNVNGTTNLFNLAAIHSQRIGQAVRFLFPSSIAVYGLPDLATKQRAGAVHEGQYNQPTTLYGITKLHGEQLGRYFARHYRQLDDPPVPTPVDFRAIRFPGLISAHTVPSGGTSDYGPEMLHHAAQGQPYACFVRPDTQIPFMTMEDGVRALLELAAAPAERLTQVAYNIGAFSVSAAELAEQVLLAFPHAEIRYEPHLLRQAIVDSWPEDVNDSAARRDWKWQPQFNFEAAFRDYLVPAITARYAVA